MSVSASGLYSSPGMISAQMPQGITARDNMLYQEYLSNTAHQREVADLQAAGLNPVLSAGGSGASVPSGSQDSADTLKLIYGLTSLVNAASGKGQDYSLNSLLKELRERHDLPYGDEVHEGLSPTGWYPGKPELDPRVEVAVLDIADAVGVVFGSDAAKRFKSYVDRHIMDSGQLGKKIWSFIQKIRSDAQSAASESGLRAAEVPLRHLF